MLVSVAFVCARYLYNSAMVHYCLREIEHAKKEKKNNQTIQLRVPAATLSQSLCKACTFYSTHLTKKKTNLTAKKGQNISNKENSDRTHYVT